MSRSKARALGLRLALLVLCSVLGAELVLRLLGVAAPAPGGYPRGLYAPDAELAFKLSPSFAGEMPREDGAVAIRTNADGFRDEPFRERRDGVTRILALGDSFSFGHNVKAPDAYPEVLERLLSADGEPAEVLNLGVPGYNTLQEAQQLERVGPALKPDLVLVGCYLGNDLSGNLERRSPRPRARNGYLIQAEPDEPEWRVTLRANLSRYSRLWRLWREWQLRRERSLDEAGLRAAICSSMDWSAGIAFELLRAEPTADAAEALALTRSAVSELATFARDTLHAGFVLVLLPSPFQYDPATLEPFLRECGLDPATLDLDWPNRELALAGEREGYAVLDLTPAFRARVSAAPAERLYFDVHFNEAGHQMAAEEIARFLLERGLLR